MLTYLYQDDSDFQYRSFREYFPLLALVMIIYLCISQISERITSSESYRVIGRPLLRYNRKTFLTVFTSVFILALHGTNTAKLLLACCVNYAIATKVSSSSYAAATPLFVWTWNVGLLFLIHWNEGFSYGSIASGLAWLVSRILR